MIWTTEYIIKNYQNLISDFQSGEVVIFVGAGFSKFAGFPTWEELLSPLKTQLNSNTNDLVKLAQEYENKFRRFNLIRHLKSELDTKKMFISKLHKILCSLPVNCFITLNFDQALEETFKRFYESKYQLIISNTDIPYLKLGSAGVPIIKANGCITNPDTLVITTNDFKKYIKNHVLIKNYIEDLLAKNTFLFVGTSFRDPIFKRFNDSVLKVLKHNKRPCYLISRNPNQTKIDELHKQGINVINLGIREDSFVVSTTKKFLENLYEAVVGKEFVEHTPQSNLKQIMDERIGSGLSFELNPSHVDDLHKYLKLYRYDLLDYLKGDFYSIRRIKIKNITEVESNFLCYSESTENKCSFEQTQVKAYDYHTKKKLEVEPFELPKKLMLTHVFKIFFPKTLRPNEEYEFIYTIKLPNELKKLSKDKEVMSISLVRILNGVDDLKFKVCLNFKPTNCYVEYIDVMNKKIILGDCKKIKKYKPKLWYEKMFNIQWSSIPYEISWSCSCPKQKGYFINYQS